MRLKNRWSLYEKCIFLTIFQIFQTCRLLTFGTLVLIHCKTPCVQQLLGARAAVDQATNDGTTPLSYARKKGQAQCVALLLAAGAKDA